MTSEHEPETNDEGHEENSEPTLDARDTMGVPALDATEQTSFQLLSKDPGDASTPANEASPAEALSVDDVLDREAKDDTDKPEWAVPQEELRAIVEALLFANGKVTSLALLAKAIPQARTRELREVLRELISAWADNAHGIHLEEVSGGYQFRTNPLAAPFIRELLKAKPLRLSRAALETLAIIAYRQPITRAEIEDVRGVDSGGVMKLLLDKRLMRILGKREEPGRPIVYGTSKDFLELFHLRSLKELPTLQDFHELNAENKAKLNAVVGHEEVADGAAKEEEDDFFKAPETQADATSAALELAHAAESLELAMREADATVAEVLGRKPYDEQEPDESGSLAEVEVLGGGEAQQKKLPRDKGLKAAAIHEGEEHPTDWQEPEATEPSLSPENDEENLGDA